MLLCPEMRTEARQYRSSWSERRQGLSTQKKKNMNKINLKFKSFSLNKRLEGRIQEKMGVSSFILLAFIAFTVSFCVFPRPYVVS